MAIAALLVHVDLGAREALCAHLAADPACLVGAPCELPAGALVPLALTSPDAASGEASYQALRDWPGVRAVEVVMIDFTDEEGGA